MMLYKTTLGILILFLTLNVRSQNTDKERSINISYANDLFTGTDQYFTQGIRIEYINPAFRKTPTKFLSVIPTKNAGIYYSLAIQQDGFTPTSIRYDSILQGDRPFCGSIFLTNSQYLFLEKQKVAVHSQISVGGIGPLAFGYEEQTAIHRAINDELPKGWKNQIQNDLILNYKIELQQAVISRKLIQGAAITQLRAGTMFTDLSLGGQLFVGYLNQRNPDLRMPSTNKFQLFAFAKSQVKAVAYNATLQGGLINRSSPYTIKNKDINRLVGTTEFGLVASYKKLQLIYSQSYISKEFKTGTTHAWGSLSLMAVF